MREYLFRGKTKQGEWVYWDMFARATKNIDNTQSLNYDTYVVFYDDEQTPTFVIKREIGGFEYLDILPETVGEYTGLTDKNGIKMFVGDIVKITSHGYIPDTQNGEIVLYNGSYCIKYKWGLSKDFIKIIYHRIGKEDTWQDMGASGIITYTYEVIGNIIDNKELLGE